MCGGKPGKSHELTSDQQPKTTEKKTYFRQNGSKCSVDFSKYLYIYNVVYIETFLIPLSNLYPFTPVCSFPPFGK